MRPVLTSARSNVLKSEGTRSMTVLAERAGMMSLSIAWITPFVACYSVSLILYMYLGGSVQCHDG